MQSENEVEGNTLAGLTGIAFGVALGTRNHD
jgi:hypothetical protein